MRRNFLPSTHEEAGGVLLGLVPVLFEDLRAGDDDFPHGALRQLGERLRIDDARVGVEYRDAEAMRLGPVARVDVRGGQGLGHAIALEIRESRDFLESRGDGFGHGRAAAANDAQRRQVVAAGVIVSDQVHDHRGHGGQIGHPVARDRGKRGLAVPARQQHQARAGVHVRVHGVLHAGDVEQWQHGERAGVLAHVVPVRDRNGGVHDAAVPVHAALGLAGRARGVADQRQVVGPGRMRRRRMRLIERFVPGRDLRLRAFPFRIAMRGAASASGSAEAAASPAYSPK